MRALRVQGGLLSRSRGVDTQAGTPSWNAAAVYLRQAIHDQAGSLKDFGPDLHPAMGACQRVG